jgi:hypothetical protein
VHTFHVLMGSVYVHVPVRAVCGVCVCGVRDSVLPVCPNVNNN